MRKIRILNLYGEALDLNGDGKNVTAFEKRIAEMGYEYETVSLGVDEETATEDACRIEHVISDKSFAAVKKYFLENET